MTPAFIRALLVISYAWWSQPFFIEVLRKQSRWRRFNYSSHDADSDFQSSHWSSLQYVQGFTECAVFRTGKGSPRRRPKYRRPDIEKRPRTGSTTKVLDRSSWKGQRPTSTEPDCWERQILAHDHGNRHCIEEFLPPSLTQRTLPVRPSAERARRLGRSTPSLLLKLHGHL